MTAVIIILSIFAFLFLISLIRIRVIAEYKNKLQLTIKVLFIKFRFKIPDKKEKPKDNTKKKSKKKKQKKSDTKNKKEKKTDKDKNKSSKKKDSPIKSMLKKQGVSGLVDILKDMLKLVKGTLRYFFKHLIIHDFTVFISVAGEDANETAVQYGAVSAVVYPATSALAQNLNVKDFSADITCNFEQDSKTEAYCYFNATIRIVFLIILALKAAVRAVKTYIKMRFR